MDYREPRLGFGLESRRKNIFRDDQGSLAAYYRYRYCLQEYVQLKHMLLKMDT